MFVQGPGNTGFVNKTSTVEHEYNVTSMDFTSLNSILKELIQDISDAQIQENIIFKFIEDVTKNKFDLGDFPVGQDWFNTAEPLSWSKHLHGKIVVLDFFTYCCINCLHVLPHLRALEENISVSEGLVVIGVHSAKFENEKESANILAALKRYNITHPVINDKDGILWNKFEISCWPTLLILGPQGQPLFTLVGEGHQDELQLYVKCALKYYKNQLSACGLPASNSNATVSTEILHFPSKLACFEDVFAVSDTGNHSIVIFDSCGYIKTRIGSKSPGFKDGSFDTVRFNSPQGLAFLDSSKLYIADTENHAIRLADLVKSTVTTVAGTGSHGTDYEGGKMGTHQQISSPWDVCLVPAKDVELPLAGGLFGNLPPPPPPAALQGGAPPPPPPAPPPLTGFPLAASATAQHKVLLIAMSGMHQLWALFLDDTTWWKGRKYKKGACAAIAGSGKEENRNSGYPKSAGFAQPSGLAYSPQLKSVFVADSESSSIRKLSLKNGSVTAVVGGDRSPENLFSYGDVDGRAQDAKLQHPLDVTWHSRGVYVCDTYNHKVKMVDPSSNTCRSLHSQTKWFNEPSGSCLGKEENVLYVADTNNHSLKTVSLADNSVKKFELKELKSETDTSKGEEWNMKLVLSTQTASLKLKLKLGPSDVHGKWQTKPTQDVTCEPTQGQLDSSPLEIKLEFAAGEATTVVPLLFDLVFCKAEVCLFKKLQLNLRIERKQDGEQLVEAYFNKTVP